MHKPLSFIILFGIVNCFAMLDDIACTRVIKNENERYVAYFMRENDEVTWVTYFHSGPLTGTYSVIVRHSDNTEKDEEELGSPKILFEIWKEMYNAQQKSRQSL